MRGHSTSGARKRVLATTSALFVVIAGVGFTEVALAGPALGGAGTPLAASRARPSAGSGTAQAAAFQVTVAGRTLAGGMSHASLVASGLASATGDGALEGLPSSAGGIQDPFAVAPSTASASPGQHAAQAQPCGFRTPSPAAAVAPSAVSCSSATASSALSSAQAAASGRLDGSSVKLGSLLGSVPVVGQAAAKALGTALGQLAGALPASGRTLLGSLLPAAQRPTTIEVTAMPSTSSVAWEGRTGSSVATTGVSQVALLPGAGRGGAALVTIDIGQARASASYGAAGGSPLSATAAPVTIEIDPPALPAQSLTLVPGQSYTLFRGTPLQTTVADGATSASTQPNGTETASATAVAVDALTGLGAGLAGGIQMIFGSASASASPPAAAPPPSATPPPAGPPVPGATIVHTGLPWAGALAPLAAVGVAGAALVVWSYRRPRARRRAGAR